MAKTVEIAAGEAGEAEMWRLREQSRVGGSRGPSAPQVLRPEDAAARSARRHRGQVVALEVVVSELTGLALSPDDVFRSLVSLVTVDRPSFAKEGAACQAYLLATDERAAVSFMAAPVRTDLTRNLPGRGPDGNGFFGLDDSFTQEPVSAALARGEEWLRQHDPEGSPRVLRREAEVMSVRERAVVRVRRQVSDLFRSALTAAGVGTGPLTRRQARTVVRERDRALAGASGPVAEAAKSWAADPH